MNDHPGLTKPTPPPMSVKETALRRVEEAEERLWLAKNHLRTCETELASAHITLDEVCK